MYEADGPSSDPPGYVPLLAWYVPSQDDANVYVFAAPELAHLRTGATYCSPNDSRKYSAGRLWIVLLARLP